MAKSWQLFVEEHLSGVEEALNSMTQQAQLASDLQECALYALQGGGKRLRPLLVLATVEALGAPISLDVVHAACALEFIHTYSLIHDDLPCMDNADMRRGRPTLHKAFGEAKALLTGDWFLTHAFCLLSKPCMAHPQLLEILARHAAGRGMIGGQWTELFAEQTSAADFEKIAAEKTGALFGAALGMGAALTAHADAVQWMQEVGIAMGVVFQIILDDLDDLETDEKSLALCYGPRVAIKIASELLKKCRVLLMRLPRPEVLLDFLSILEAKTAEAHMRFS